MSKNDTFRGKSSQKSLKYDSDESSSFLTTKETVSKIGDIYTPVENEQEIAVVIKNFGGGIFNVRTFNGKILKVHQGKSCHAFLQKDDTVLISLRLFGRVDGQNSRSRDGVEKSRPQGDVLYKYTPKEIRLLTSNGYVMNTPDESAEFAGFGLDIVFVYEDENQDSDSDSDAEQAKKPSKGYLSGFDLPDSDSDSDTDDTDETEILFPIKDTDEEICFTSTLSKTKRERQHVKQKEFIDIFTCEEAIVVAVATSKEESFSRQEFVEPKIETFIGKISWFDRTKNFGEATTSFEGKEINVFIPKSAIERSIQQGLLSGSKVFFSRDKVKITAYKGKKGFEAQTINC